MRKRYFEKRSQGMVSLWGLILAVLLGVMLGGLTAWLPAQTGGASSGKCDWGMFPYDCAGRPERPDCDHSRCRNDPDCRADCYSQWVEDYWCQNPDPMNPSGLCCQCKFWKLYCKCVTTGRVVYIVRSQPERLEGAGKCTRVIREGAEGAECPLPFPPP